MFPKFVVCDPIPGFLILLWLVSQKSQGNWKILYHLKTVIGSVREDVYYQGQQYLKGSILWVLGRLASGTNIFRYDFTAERMIFVIVVKLGHFQLSYYMLYFCTNYFNRFRYLGSKYKAYALIWDENDKGFKTIWGFILIKNDLSAVI